VSHSTQILVGVIAAIVLVVLAEPGRISAIRKILGWRGK